MDTTTDQGKIKYMRSLISSAREEASHHLRGLSAEMSDSRDSTLLSFLLYKSDDELNKQASFIINKEQLKALSHKIVEANKQLKLFTELGSADDAKLLELYEEFIQNFNN